MRTKRIIIKEEEPKFDKNFRLQEDFPNKKNISADTFQLMRIFNWYNQHNKHDKARKWLSVYAQKTLTEDQVKAIEEAKYIPYSLCWLSRQAEITELPKKIISRLKEDILRYLPKNDVLTCTANKPRRNIQDYVKEQSIYFASVLNVEIDDWIESGCKDLYDAKSFLTKYEIKHIHIPMIVEKLKSRLTEYSLAHSGKDEDLVEAYSVFPKEKLKKMIDCLVETIDILNQHRDESKSLSKKLRKPRTVKKNPQKSVSKLRYMREESNLKIRSINPVDIIDSEQLWTYNTKTRKLCCYNAANVHGLFVHGSTIRNFDEKKSLSKTLRKPDLILSEIMKCSKVLLRKTFEKIRSKEKPLNGRINSDVLLLRVF